MRIPVVCAVNGVAAGAGANIALACDLVLAARSARFIQSFIKIGLVPDAGGSFSCRGWSARRGPGAGHARRSGRCRTGGSLGHDLEGRRRRSAGGRSRNPGCASGHAADRSAGANQAGLPGIRRERPRRPTGPGARVAAGIGRHERFSRGCARIPCQAAADVHRPRLTCRRRRLLRPWRGGPVRRRCGPTIGPARALACGSKGSGPARRG